ncbi:MAG: LysM domain-containing protein [Opitutaceae bacterium]
MDTISRENNSSMLPVGGIIVGVVALLLGGYAALTLSKVNKTLAAHEEKIAKIDSVETQVVSAAADASSAKKAIGEYYTQTQNGFNSVVSSLTKMTEDIVKLQDATKKPALPVAGKGATGPVVAGPDEYVVKSGDGGTKIATAHGVTLAELQAVNPGVSWTSLKVGQKLKLPAKK